MTTLAIIPARLAASRLPGKPLRLLGGRPLILRVLERVAEMQVADRCVVATDSAEIARVVKGAGGECVLTGAHPSGTDRVAEAAAVGTFAGYDVIVNVQGDEPFVSEAAVAGATNLVTSGRFPLGTAAARGPASILDAADIVKVVSADDGRAMYFSRAGIPALRDPSDRATRDLRVLRHVGVYAYTRRALAAWVALPPHPLELVERLEQLRPLAAGLAMGVALIDEEPVGGIDTEADLARANVRWTDLSPQPSVSR